MGAVAISALVGATLVEHVELSHDVAQMVPFVKGFTVFFWAIATLWIPMLLVLGVWRYLICAVPVAYDPASLGRRIPIGHVFRRHILRGKDPGGAVPDATVAAVHGRRRSRLGGDLRRACR